MWSPRSLSFVPLALLVACGCSSSASADVLVNGSFELGAFTPVINDSYVVVESGSSQITGWSVGGDGVDWHQNSFEIQSAFSGSRMVDLTGSISQSFSSVVGESYLLRFALAGPGQAPAFPDPRRLMVSVAGFDSIVSVPASEPLALSWTVFEFPFTATSTLTTLRFESVDRFGYWGPFLDDVSVTVVPAPGTAWGLLALGLFKRRRR